jgi:hypothetical protein
LHVAACKHNAECSQLLCKQQQAASLD